MRRLALAVVLVLVAGGGATIAGAAGGGTGDGRVDLKVGLAASDGCSPNADELPVMVSAADLQPDASTEPVTVCARSKGATDMRLTLALTEVEETELACTGDEAAVDTTCGGGQAGELGAHLVVAVAVQPRCRGPFGSTATVAFRGGPTVVTPVMKNNQVDCVRLSLAYRPQSAEAAASAQTDRVRWRYAFDLSG